MSTVNSSTQPAIGSIIDPVVGPAPVRASGIASGIAKDVDGASRLAAVEPEIEAGIPVEVQSKFSPEVPKRTRLVSDTLATGVLFALVLTVGQRVIGFVRGVLFCRYMTDQELGQWSMVWSFLMLLAPLAMLGLPGCFGKYSEYFRRRGQLKTFIWRVGAVSFSTTLLFAATILMFPEWFSQLFFRDASQIIVVQSLAVALVAVAISNFAISLMESLRQVRVVTFMRFVTGMAFAVIGTGLLIVWKNNVSAVTLAYGACCLLGTIPAFYLWSKFRGQADDGRLIDAATDTCEATEVNAKRNAGSVEALTQLTMWQRIAPFAFWLWVSNLLHNLFEVSDRYMLIHWSDTTAEVAQAMVGQYHSGRVIPLLMVSVAAMLAGVLLPYMSAAWEAGKKSDAVRQLNWTYKLVGISFTAGGLLVLMTAPIFFDWILQGRYNDGRSVLPLTLVYCVWFSLYTVGQDYLWVAEKGKLATLAIGVGLVANIVLNVVLIPWLGLSGAVIATTSGNFLVISLILWLNHRNGCPTDLGIWLISMLPLLLLLSPWAGCLALAAMIGMAHRTTWIFSGEEKQQGIAAWESVRAKFNKTAKS
jgi:PST family polysaccharide transporter